MENLSAAEREPYYESLNKYNKDIIVWKETTSQDGRMEVIKGYNCLEGDNKSRWKSGGYYRM